MKFDEQNKPVLNGPETEAAQMRDYLHDHGMSAQASARDALAPMKRPSRAFVEWLSQGTLTLDHGEVVDKEPEDAAAQPANA